MPWTQTSARTRFRLRKRLILRHHVRASLDRDDEVRLRHHGFLEYREPRVGGHVFGALARDDLLPADLDFLEHQAGIVRHVRQGVAVSDLVQPDERTDPCMV